MILFFHCHAQRFMLQLATDYSYSKYVAFSRCTTPIEDFRVVGGTDTVQKNKCRSSTFLQEIPNKIGLCAIFSLWIVDRFMRITKAANKMMQLIQQPNQTLGRSHLRLHTPTVHTVCSQFQKNHSVSRSSQFLSDSYKYILSTKIHYRVFVVWQRHKMTEDLLIISIHMFEEQQWQQGCRVMYFSSCSNKKILLTGYDENNILWIGFKASLIHFKKNKLLEYFSEIYIEIFMI